MNVGTSGSHNGLASESYGTYTHETPWRAGMRSTDGMRNISSIDGDGGDRTGNP